MLLKKSKKSVLKITLAAVGLTTIIAATTLGAAACAPAQTGQQIISKENGKLFASNELGATEFSIEDAVKSGLSNPAGSDILFKSRYEELMLDSLDNIIKNSSNIILQNQFKEQKDKIDEEFQTFLDGLNLEGRDREIAIQSELDGNGGTVEAWKRNKLTAWATTYLSERFFKNDYTNIIDVQGGVRTVVGSPDRQAITQALSNKVNNIGTGYQMGFGAKPNSSDEAIFNKIFTDATVALQEKVYKMYVQEEKPFVLNMNLWKYSASGVGSSFDDVWANINPASPGTDAEGNPTPPPPAGGSYPTPYFSDVKTADNLLTPIEKFKNFNLANTSNSPGTIESIPNFKPTAINQVPNAGIGLRDSMRPSWTDDSSNFILVEPSKWSLVNEFMLSSFALFNLDNGLTGPESLFSSNLIQNNPASFLGNTVINEQFDLISRSFMSATQPLNANSARINASDFTRMLNQANGRLAPIFQAPRDIYSIDAFKSNNVNTNEFIYLRNQFGVHAIALDGWDYIKTGTTFQERIDHASDILMYRSLQNRENSTQPNVSEATKTFQVPLNQKMKEYYDANLTKVWTSIFADIGTDPLSQTIVNNLLGTTVVANSFIPSEVNLFTALYKYNDLKANIDITKTRNAGLMTAKSVYSSVHGVNSFKNGIASPYIFGQQNNGIFNEVLMFMNNGVQFNEVSFLQNQYKILIENVNAYIVANPETIKPLVSTDSSFPFSQKILANDYGINKVIYNFTISNAEYFSNTLTNNIVEQSNLFGTVKVSDVLKFEKTLPAAGLNPFTFNLTPYGMNAQLADFNFQFINKFLGSSVTNSSIGADINKYVDVASPLGIASVNEVQDYKQQLYFKDTYANNVTMEATREKLLMFTLGLNYMLEDSDAIAGFGDRFIARAKQEMNINESGSFTWWNKFSQPLVPAATLARINSPEKLLNQNLTTGSTMFLNQNNNISSQYINNDGVYLNPQEVGGVFHNLYENTGYGEQNTFKYNKNKAGTTLSGYSGLEKEISTDLPADLKEYVFPNGPRLTGPTTEPSLQGILYQYGSRENLVKFVEINQNTTEINNLAISIRNKLNSKEVTSQVQAIIEVEALSKKQELMIPLLNNVGLIPNLVFQNFTGYTNGNAATGNLVNGKDNFTVYGAFQQQVNFEDFNYQKNPTTGAVILGPDESGAMVVPQEITTIEQLSSNIGTSLMLDLLIDFSMETSAQTNAFNNIARDNKFTIFDKDTRNALGEIWVKNYDL